MLNLDFFNKQKTFFLSGKTRSVQKRIQLLEKLDSSITSNESKIFEALKKDLNKSNFESYLTEIAILKSEIKLIKKKLKKWSKPKRVKSTLASFPSKDYLFLEPYGITLIISPWNYPFQLALLPLISSIAAGNTVVIKPSEHSPHTSKLIQEIISSIFSDEYVKVILGDSKVASKLLELRWDYIFFTGSVNVGKIVAKAASKFLTPLTLELGGKNPCIIDKDTDIKLTAKRLIWGKFVNAGQTCIAPDYLIVEKTIKKKLIDELILEIERAYGKNQEDSMDYPRIINKQNTERLISMLYDQEIIYGGNYKQFGLAGDLTASFFGKVCREDDPRKDISDADIARSLVVMITQNISQLAFINARACGSERVVFTGSFLHHNDIACRTLAYGMHRWSQLGGR